MAEGVPKFYYPTIESSTSSYAQAQIFWWKSQSSEIGLNICVITKVKMLHWKGRETVSLCLSSSPPPPRQHHRDRTPQGSRFLQLKEAPQAAFSLLQHSKMLPRKPTLASPQEEDGGVSAVLDHLRPGKKQGKVHSNKHTDLGNNSMHL